MWKRAVVYNHLSQVSRCDYYKLKRFLNLLEKTYITSLVKPFFTHKTRFGFIPTIFIYTSISLELYKK